MSKKRAASEPIADIQRQQVVLPVQCGHCLFHHRMATYEHPCDQLGTPASAQTCRRFVPDPQMLGEETGRVLRVLGTAASPTLVAAIMLSAKKVARSGFALGQTVYLKVVGGEYVNNYASGVVIGVSRDHVVVSGHQGYTALVLPESLLSRAQWLAKLEGLVKRERVNDPAGGLRRLPVNGKNRLVAYEPEPIGRGAKRKPPRKAAAKPSARGKGGTTYIGAKRRV